MTHSQQLEKQIREHNATITIVGLGYVGLPLALGFAQKGFKVFGLDDQTAKVDMLLSGTDYINGQHDVLKSCLDKGFEPTRDVEVLSRSQVIVICVPTPLTKNREPDISYVQSVSERIGQLIQRGTLVVLESTTYPGTTEEVVLPAILAGKRVATPGIDFHLAFSPERVDPGNPSYDTYNTTKVVGGVTPECTRLTALLYQSMLVRAELVRTASNARAAEMEKLFENIFRSVNIALVNELALLCRQMDLDVWEILELASTKPFGFMRFNPGPGIGGHCIPLDPFYLTWKAREFDFPTRFIELAGELNNRMPYHVVDLAVEGLAEKGLQNSRVLLLGIAYKKDVGDYRESPALKVLDILKKKGARVDYHDPLVARFSVGMEAFESVPEANISSYDCVILMTDHTCFDLEQLVPQCKVLVDTRGATRNLENYGSARVLVLGAPTPEHQPQPAPVGV
jgi:UDP-N-acetyl-D-glucosamine dehydrogenase